MSVCIEGSRKDVPGPYAPSNDSTTPSAPSAEPKGEAAAQGALRVETDIDLNDIVIDTRNCDIDYDGEIIARLPGVLQLVIRDPAVHRAVPLEPTTKTIPGKYPIHLGLATARTRLPGNCSREEVAVLCRRTVAHAMTALLCLEVDAWGKSMLYWTYRGSLPLDAKFFERALAIFELSHCMRECIQDSSENFVEIEARTVLDDINGVTVRDVDIKYFDSVKAGVPSEELPADPESDVPEECAKIPANGKNENALPENILPENALPKEIRPEDTLPEETRAKETLPEEALPKNANTKNSLPTSALHDNALSENSLPKNAIPDNSLPNSTLPDNAQPKDALPENSIPESSLPDDTFPENSDPADPEASECDIEDFELHFLFVDFTRQDKARGNSMRGSVADRLVCHPPDSKIYDDIDIHALRATFAALSPIFTLLRVVRPCTAGGFLANLVTMTRALPGGIEINIPEYLPRIDRGYIQERNVERKRVAVEKRDEAEHTLYRKAILVHKGHAEEPLRNDAFKQLKREWACTLPTVEVPHMDPLYALFSEGPGLLFAVPQSMVSVIESRIRNVRYLGRTTEEPRLRITSGVEEPVVWIDTSMEELKKCLGA